MKKINKNEIRNKINNAWCQTKSFVVENKEIIVVVAPVVIAVVGKTVGFLNKTAVVKKQQKLHDNYCYDRRLGHYWELRRKPSSAEWLFIDREKKNGRSLAEILDGMKILK